MVTDPAERPFVHASASVEAGAQIGSGTRIWALSQVRSGAVVGRSCTIGRNVFIDVDVRVGDGVKVQNNSLLFEGLRLHDGVFVGPQVVFTNDRVPRAVSANGVSKTGNDWILGHTEVLRGAAIGAGSVVVTGVTIGRWSMVGAGAVVTRDVPDHALVLGNPARVVGYVSASGVRYSSIEEAEEATRLEQEGSGP